MQKEYIDVLDYSGNSLGIVKTREEIHRSGDMHRVVHVWIYNKNGQILLQQRSETKENHPLCWDISSAGHVHAFENSQESAIREIYEELGLKVDKQDLNLIDTVYRTQYPLNQEIADIYLLKKEINLSDLRFIDQEVADAKWFSLAQIKHFIEQKADHFVIREEYPLILEKVENDLQI